LALAVCGTCVTRVLRRVRMNWRRFETDVLAGFVLARAAAGCRTGRSART